MQARNKIHAAARDSIIANGMKGGYDRAVASVFQSGGNLDLPATIPSITAFVQRTALSRGPRRIALQRQSADRPAEIHVARTPIVKGHLHPAAAQMEFDDG